MQSYQIQVKEIKGNITQYYNHIQGTEKRWIEYIEIQLKSKTEENEKGMR